MNECLTYVQPKMLHTSHNSVMPFQKRGVIAQQPWCTEMIKTKTSSFSRKKKIHTKIAILALFFRPQTHGRSVIYGQKDKLAIK